MINVEPGQGIKSWGFKEIAILCEPCYQNGCFDTMWPGSGHDDQRVWGIADIETANDDGDWDLTWLASGLTLAQAETALAGMEFPGGWHRMG